MQFADEITATNKIYVLIGPPKQGKTVCAATISEFCPDVLPAKEKTYLKDTVWLQFDSDGVESLRGLNIIPYVEDLSTFTELKTIMPAFREAIGRIKAKIAEKQIRFVVVDTLTALDKIVVTEKNKQITDARVHGAITGTHMDFVKELKSLPCYVLVVSHTKYVGAFQGQETPEFQGRRRAGGMPGRAEIGMALSNGAADYWRTQASGILPVYTTRDGKEVKYTVLTVPKFGFECGHRLKNLDEEEPAHLRKLLQKAGAY